jgi:prepilin-type N-terminal cleavage/methylation domain-containing protein
MKTRRASMDIGCMIARHQRPSPPEKVRGRAFSAGSHRRGYSLLELAMVLAIMGILAAIATPRFAEVSSRQRAVAAARRIASDIALARASARTASASRKVTFSLRRNAYTLPQLRDPLLNTPAPYLITLSAAPYEAKLVAASFGTDTAITFSHTGGTDVTGAVELVFNGYGEPDSSGWVVVRSGMTLYNVAVDAAGVVSVQWISEQGLANLIASSTGATVEVAL